MYTYIYIYYERYCVHVSAAARDDAAVEDNKKKK